MGRIAQDAQVGKARVDQWREKVGVEPEVDRDRPVEFDRERTQQRLVVQQPFAEAG